MLVGGIIFLGRGRGRGRKVLLRRKKDCCRITSALTVARAVCWKVFIVHGVAGSSLAMKRELYFHSEARLRCFEGMGVKKDRMKHEWQPAMVLRHALSGDCKLYEEVNVSVFEDSCWIC